MRVLTDSCPSDSRPFRGHISGLDLPGGHAICYHCQKLLKLDRIKTIRWVLDEFTIEEELF